MSVRDAVIRYVSYAVMVAAVAAALLGALEGDGHASADASDGSADVHFPRITKQGLKPWMVVDVTNGDRIARQVSVDLSSRYLQEMQLSGVTPDPQTVRGVGHDGTVRYTFAAIAAGERLRAVFSFSIDQAHPGLRSHSPLRVAVGDRPVLTTDIATTVLP